MTGLIAGRVTCHIRRKAEARSIAAASYRLGSTFDIAARKMIIDQPVSFQMTWLVINSLNSSGTPMIWKVARSASRSQRVEHPGVAEHLLEQRDHDHPGQEVRQVEDRLDDALDALAQHAVQDQRQHDRQREDEDDLDQA